MDVKSFGCSFIFGSELSDDGYGGPYATPSQLTWPAHLARHLGHGYNAMLARDLEIYKLQNVY